MLPQLVSPVPTRAQTVQDPFFQRAQESSLIPGEALRYVPLLVVVLIVYFVFFHKKKKR